MCEALVRGEIVFDPPPLDLAGAKAFIRLEQTSLADMPSQVICEQILCDLAAKMVEGRKLPFAMYGSLVNPRERYTLSVHIDLQGDGSIRAGDYINMQSYPVLTFGYPTQVVVEVHQV
ncbi:MAG: hypothetical protein JXA78_14805 [Anaerolineales bacterium]|nr:hypothetical protein [Anaerolineales bacterium]